MAFDEHAAKRDRLLAVLEAERLDALVLRRPGNVAWYSCGGRTHVVATPEIGVADVVVKPEGDEVVTAVNEAPRLEAEELGALDATFTVLGWDEDRVPALPAGRTVGSDSGLPGTKDVASSIEAARRGLTPPEVERYRALGRDAAEALTETCLALAPAHSELSAAARLSAALLTRGAEPIVLLVAGETRLPHHRHPLPTSAPVGRLAMLVTCARRNGLIASLTRVVAFGSLPGDVRSRHARLVAVDAAFNLATRPGRSVGEAFREGLAAYEAEGFGPDEWRLHHQGGPTGYEPRDYLAGPDSASIVEEGQAFAWNPSAPELKSEDTVIARAAGPEVLTVDPAWPTLVAAGMQRPLVLER